MPAVRFHLEDFGKWAGIFMQLVGLAEAIRRLTIHGNDAWAIQPQSPAVVLSGTQTAGQPRRVPVKTTTTMPSRARPQPDLPLDIVPDDDPPLTLDEEALLDVERIVANYTPDTFAAHPRLADKIRAELDTYITYGPDGMVDVAANNSDTAVKAINVTRKVDELEAASRIGA